MTVLQESNVAEAYIGVAADVKPTSGVGVGSTFFATDTLTQYIWDGDSWEALPSGAGEGANYVGNKTITGDLTVTGNFNVVGTSDVHNDSLLFAPDNTYDLGMNATTSRPRDLFLGRNARIGGNMAVGGALPTGVTLAVPVAPTATPNYGLLSIGGGPFDGSTSGFFAGNSNGTHLAINAAVGYLGRMIDAQVGGVRVMGVGRTTLASAAGTSLRAIDFPANTVVVTGNTGITTAGGFNYFEIGQPTYSAALALTTLIGATFMVAGAPIAAGVGPLTLTNPLAVWIQAGTSRFDGAITVPIAASATANTGLVSLGAGPFDGTTAGFFVGNALGTHLAINAASGFAGRMIDAQIAGVRVFGLGALSRASATSAILDSVDFPTQTITVTGATAITTATGFNYFTIGKPAIVSAANITNAATLVVTGAPTISGGGALTNAYPFWVQSGLSRIDGSIEIQGPGGAGTTSGLIRMLSADRAHVTGIYAISNGIAFSHDGTSSLSSDTSRLFARGAELNLGGSTDTGLVRQSTGVMSITTQLNVGTALGLGSVSTPDALIQRSAAASLLFGAAASATPASYTLTGGESSRGGTDTNVAGGSLTIRSGLGTGTGTVTSIVLQTPTVAAGGSGAQSYATRGIFSEVGLGIGATAPGLLNISTFTYLTLTGIGTNSSIIEGQRGTASATQDASLLAVDAYNGATRVGEISFTGDGSTTSGNFTFWTKATGGALTERVRIDSNGLLSVGQLKITPTLTVASGASATLGAISVPATTITLSGSTAITTAGGFNFMDIAAPLFTGAGAIAITRGATLTLRGAPTVGGSVTLTNPYVFWTQAGAIRLDGNTQAIAATANLYVLATTGSGASNPATPAQNAWLQMEDATGKFWIPIWR